MDLIETVLWSISNICNGVKNFDNLKPFVFSLSNFLHENNDLLTDTLRMHVAWSFAYITDGESERIQSLIATGVLSILTSYLTDISKTALLVPTLRVFGNISSGSDDQTQTVLDCGVLNFLSKILDLGSVSGLISRCSRLH